LEYLSLLHELFEPAPKRVGDRVRRVGNRWSPKQPRALNRRSGDLRLPRRSPATRFGQTVEPRSLSARRCSSFSMARTVRELDRPPGKPDLDAREVRRPLAIG